MQSIRLGHASRLAEVALLFLIGAAGLLGATPVLAQSNSTALPPNPEPGPGWHGPLNGSGIVASSPAGSAVGVSIGEPSWLQDSFSFPGPRGSSSGVSFPAYEVFPVTIHASPGTLVELQAGRAVPTEQQVAEYGVRNSTIWTWFSPNPVKADSSGVASSNFTLADAVMPFTEDNTGANVMLPITAVAQSGQDGTASLPIVFEGEGGISVLTTVGPISLGTGIQAGVDQTSYPIFGAVYSPYKSSPTPAPIQVSLQVIGVYESGVSGQPLGPAPSSVQITFPQPSFQLTPYSPFYFAIGENNSLTPSNSSAPASYTFAVQEKVGNSTYVEPLHVSVTLQQIITGPAPGLTTGLTNSSTATSRERAMPGAYAVDSSSWFVAALVPIAVVATVVVAVFVRRRTHMKEKAEEEQPPPPPQA